MSKVNEDEIDPDYAMHNIALKRAEKLKEENTNSVEKLKEILNEEFNKDLVERQNQLEQIEKQIHKTRKLMHLMRYVLISSYYNKKELEYNGNDEVLAKAETSYLFDQNRIHPALKKLLGKNGSAPDFNICRSARRNKGDSKPNVMVENLSSDKFKNVDPSSHKSTSSQVMEGCSTPQQTIGFERNRQKIKNQVIVGNISKWMPSSEEDKLTHKWMVYVRGPKENPDVSHFIEKVVFYLHPSYKPDDVVEVSKPPFHLSRMGWGEFPIRLQIYFVCTRNKPLEIFHNLKLDKTYSGRQTLGNETIFDFYLYDDKLNNSSESEDIQGYINSSNSHSRVEKKHEIVAVTDICEKETANSTEESVPNFEHDYCTEDMKPDIGEITLTENNYDSHSFEHSYSYPPTHEFFNIEVKKNKPELIQQQKNPLIYGLDESYSETYSDMKKKEPLFYRKTLVYTTKDPTFKSSQASSSSKAKVVGNKKRSSESLVKKMYTKKLYSQSTTTNSSSEIETTKNHSIQIKLPRNDRNILKFKNLGEALPYIFKRAPLIADIHNNIYPFTASSSEEYNSWSLSQQTNAEWSRAKVIKTFIDNEQVHEHEKWSAKTIMIYGKSHGYSPKANLSAPEKNTAEIKLINNCFSSSVDLPYSPQKYSADISLDIVNESESPQKKKQKLQCINISDPTLQMECSYIREEALECGVVLKSEQIEDDIIFNGAERMILEAVKCLANHLVRRSLHFASTSRSFNGEINTVHLQKARNERKELNALTQFRIKQTNKKYFF
ncbi:YEATS domain-containing protein 2-like [Coccinella septempunctata]|uniref:YEATS domain-containing protein 2-like n=1 Tax=Coccinella septempunctata TaxID=41139 RepID=UPI001D091BD0|nr:YEATS domain-containing protein 2-like [Coccinella septempunctata]